MIDSKFIQFDKQIVHKDQIIMIEQINHMKVRITTTAMSNGENLSFETNCEFKKIALELSVYSQTPDKKLHLADEQL